MMQTTKVVNPDWLTRKQAAALLQVGLRTVDRYIADGKLVARNLSPRTVRISAASIDKLLPGTR